MELPKTQDEIIAELQKAIENSKHFLTKYQNQYINNLRKKCEQVMQDESNRLVKEYRGRNVDLQQKIIPKLKAIQISYMQNESNALKEMEEDPLKFGEEQAEELLKVERFLK